MPSDDYECLERTLSEIIGRQLTSVVFIHDYLQFIFDGPCLTALTVPTFRKGDGVLSSGQPGYCDALCSQIGVPVCGVGVQGHHLAIVFTSGAELRMSLLDADYVGPEAINYVGEDGNWLIE